MWQHVLKYFTAWFTVMCIFSLGIFLWSGIYVVKPGTLVLVQHHNGEVDVVDTVGYHWTMGKTVPMQKSMIQQVMPGGGTLYDGKTSVGESFDLSSPNKKLYRIK
jgi:hypothetical protein